MALCKKYEDLTPIERSSFIGQLVHATQSNDTIYEMAKDLIKLAILKGCFDGVKINPQVENNSDQFVID